MVLIDGHKYACANCIKGHRSSHCKHEHRLVFEIKKKGRPVTQCPDCRAQRKLDSLHTKCTCQPTSSSRPTAPVIPHISEQDKLTLAAKGPNYKAYQAIERAAIQRGARCQCRSQHECACGADRSNTQRLDSPGPPSTFTGVKRKLPDNTWVDVSWESANEWAPSEDNQPRRKRRGRQPTTKKDAATRPRTTSSSGSDSSEDGPDQASSGPSSAQLPEPITPPEAPTSELPLSSSFDLFSGLMHSDAEATAGTSSYQLLQSLFSPTQPDQTMCSTFPFTSHSVAADSTSTFTVPPHVPNPGSIEPSTLPDMLSVNPVWPLAEPDFPFWNTLEASPSSPPNAPNSSSAPQHSAQAYVPPLGDLSLSSWPNDTTCFTSSQAASAPVSAFEGNYLSQNRPSLSVDPPLYSPSPGSLDALFSVYKEHHSGISKQRSWDSQLNTCLNPTSTSAMANCIF